jgi:hypothetical protein
VRRGLQDPSAVGTHSLGDRLQQGRPVTPATLVGKHGAVDVGGGGVVEQRQPDRGGADDRVAHLREPEGGVVVDRWQPPGLQGRGPRRAEVEGAVVRVGRVQHRPHVVQALLVALVDGLDVQVG